jgi:hypothetical protein
MHQKAGAEQLPAGGPDGPRQHFEVLLQGLVCRA